MAVVPIGALTTFCLVSSMTRGYLSFILYDVPPPSPPDLLGPLLWPIPRHIARSCASWLPKVEGYIDMCRSPVIVAERLLGKRVSRLVAPAPSVLTYARQPVLMPQEQAVYLPGKGGCRWLH